MTLPEIDVLTRLVERVFRVEDVTREDSRQGAVVRYRGEFLASDTAAAYDSLAEAMKPYHLVPLFRSVGGRPVIFIAAKPPRPKSGSPLTNLVLFILTVLSVMLAGSVMQGTGGAELPPDTAGQLRFLAEGLFSGWPFAASLMGILLAHEFGHYLMSRYHKTAATLPYFIPLPISPLGTMGAFISMREIPRNKRILFDIGVAGPLAGLVVAVPVLLYGLSRSSLGTIEATPGGFLEGNSLMYLLAKFTIFGQLLPSPGSGTHGALYWIQYFFTGQPIPFGGTDVFIDPIAFAGWAGLLVTGLNLLPAGTLDGGHVVYALFGDKASRAFPFVLVALGILGYFWNGWWLWAVLLLWLGRVQAQPLDQITTLDAPRRALAVVVIIIFALTFSPVPFMPLSR